MHSQFPSAGGTALGGGASRVAFGRRRVSRRFWEAAHLVSLLGRRRVSRRFSRNSPPSEGRQTEGLTRNANSRRMACGLYRRMKKRQRSLRSRIAALHIGPPRPCGAPLQGRGILRTACVPRTCGLPATLTYPTLSERYGIPRCCPDTPAH